MIYYLLHLRFIKAGIYKSTFRKLLLGIVQSIKSIKVCCWVATIKEHSTKISLSGKDALGFEEHHEYS